MLNKQLICPFCKKNKVGNFSVINEKTRRKEFVCDVCVPAIKNIARRFGIKMK